jgi:hypothetical protein
MLRVYSRLCLFVAETLYWMAGVASTLIDSSELTFASLAAAALTFAVAAGQMQHRRVP